MYLDRIKKKKGCLRVEFHSHPTGVFTIKQLKEDLNVQFHVRFLENSLQISTHWVHHPVQICLSEVRM